MEIAIVLALPLLGALLLALTGHRAWAPELNATMSFATFFAAVLLTARVISGGPMIWVGERFVADPSNVLLVVLAELLRGQFFVDSFNVFLVALTAFVGFTTALFSRP